MIGMKAIISGKRYNTETATLVADDSAGSRSDFRYYSEGLYKTPLDNWFIAGEGGAMSRWAQSCFGGGRVGGSGIKPLTPDEAREWLENAGEDEAIEEHFGAVIEDA